MNNPVIIAALALSLFLTFVGIGLTAQRAQRSKAQERTQQSAPVTATPRMWREVDEVLRDVEERYRQIEWL